MDNSINEINQYLDNHNVTPYMAAKLSGMSKSTLYDAVAESRTLDKQTIAVIKAIAKATDRKPGQVLDSLIDIENDNVASFNPYAVYKYYLGLLSYLVNDFVLRSEQNNRPSLKLREGETSLYIKMFFAIVSIIQWLRDSFGNDLIHGLLESNELISCFNTTQDENKYEINILNQEDINDLFDYLLKNLSSAKEGNFDFLDNSFIRPELKLSIRNSINEMLQNETSDDIVDSQINAMRDDWLEKASFTPGLRIIVYVNSENNELNVLPLWIDNLPKEIKVKYGFAIPKIETLLINDKYNFINYDALTGRIKIKTNFLSHEEFSALINEMDFEDNQDWLKLTDEAEFLAYKDYIYSLDNHDYETVSEATKVYKL